MCEGYFLQFGDPVDFGAWGNVDDVVDGLKWVTEHHDDEHSEEG